MKEVKNFQTMNCDDCQCNVCLAACINCSRCYRSEYSKENFEDYYIKGNGESECCELD